MLKHVYDKDNVVLSLLADTLLQPDHLTSLTRLRLDTCSGTYPVNYRYLFDALFKISKERLVNLTLELIDVEHLDQEDII